MRSRSELLAVLTLAFAVAACQPPVQEAGPLSEEEVAAVRGVGASYQQAELANDPDAVAALYTEDAVMMPPNLPAVEGREAIRAALGARGLTVTEYTITTPYIDGRGDFAYVRGTYSIVAEVEGMAEPYSDTGKALVVLRKQADGSWLITVLCYNSDLPLPEEGSGT